MQAAVWAVLCSVVFHVVADGVRGGGRKAGKIEVSCGGKSKDEIAYWECIWLKKENKNLLMGGNGKIGVPLLNDAGKENLFIDEKWQNVAIGSLLFKQRLATIFSLQGKPDILLKYEINCDTPKEIHPC